MIASCKLIASGMLVVLLGVVTWAEENAVPISAERIAELVKQLDADDFAVREKAVGELVQAGPAALEAVVAAAQGESLESATRAFSILDKWLYGSDAAPQDAALAALEKLSQGHATNTAARRAKALLAKQRPTMPTRQPMVVFGGAVRAFAAPIPVAGLGVARVELRAMAEMAEGVRGRRMSVSVGKGTKTTKVEEDNLSVEIVETEKDGIKIKVVEKLPATKKDAAKEKTAEYAAKTVDELKEKQPAGFKVYEKYAGAMNGIKIKMGAVAPAFEAAGPLEARAMTDAEREVMLAKKAAELELRRAEFAAKRAELLKKMEQIPRQQELPQRAPAE